MGVRADLQGRVEEGYTEEADSVSILRRSRRPERETL